MTNSELLLREAHSAYAFSSLFVELPHYILPRENEVWSTTSKYVVLTACGALALFGIFISIIEVVFWMGLALLSSAFSLLTFNWCECITPITLTSVNHALHASNMFFMLTTFMVFLLWSEQEWKLASSTEIQATYDKEGGDWNGKKKVKFNWLPYS